METHVTYMAFHLSINQCTFFSFISIDERLAPVIENLNAYIDISSPYGCIFAKVA